MESKASCAAPGMSESLGEQTLDEFEIDEYFKTFVPEDGGNIDSVECTKNPGHEDFIPILDFKLKNLPEEYQDEEILNNILLWADLTVKILVKYVSRERPETYQGSTASFPNYNFRGSKRKTTRGTGYIYSITQKDDITELGLKTCPCLLCQKSVEPQEKCWYFTVITSVHMIFDTSEAERSVIECFYDSDESRSETVKCLYGIAMYPQMQRDQEKMSYVICVTHDKELAVRLQDLIQRRFENIRDNYSSSFGPTVLISHPHGCSKTITVGEVLHLTVPTGADYLTDKPIRFDDETECILPYESLSSLPMLDFAAAYGLDLPTTDSNSNLTSDTSDDPESVQSPSNVTRDPLQADPVASTLNPTIHPLPSTSTSDTSDDPDSVQSPSNITPDPLQADPVASTLDPTIGPLPSTTTIGSSLPNTIDPSLSNLTSNPLQCDLATDTSNSNSILSTSANTSNSNSVLSTTANTSNSNSILSTTANTSNSNSILSTSANTSNSNSVLSTTANTSNSNSILSTSANTSNSNSVLSTTANTSNSNSILSTTANTSNSNSILSTTANTSNSNSILSTTANTSNSNSILSTTANTSSSIPSLPLDTNGDIKNTPDTNTTSPQAPPDKTVSLPQDLNMDKSGDVDPIQLYFVDESLEEDVTESIPESDHLMSVTLPPKTTFTLPEGVEFARRYINMKALFQLPPETKFHLSNGKEVYLPPEAKFYSNAASIQNGYMSYKVKSCPGSSGGCMLLDGGKGFCNTFPHGGTLDGEICLCALRCYPILPSNV